MPTMMFKVTITFREGKEEVILCENFDTQDGFLIFKCLDEGRAIRLDVIDSYRWEAQ